MKASIFRKRNVAISLNLSRASHRDILSGIFDAIRNKVFVFSEPNDLFEGKPTFPDMRNRNYRKDGVIVCPLASLKGWVSC